MSKQHQGLHQTQHQQLSPQQIQFIKLMQIPTAELEVRVEEELEVNPALEEGEPTDTTEEEEKDSDKSDKKEDDWEDNANMEDYVKEEDFYVFNSERRSETMRETPYSGVTSLADNLLTQLGYMKITDRERIIAQQLVGSIDGDGYMRRNIEAMVNDIAFVQNIEVTEAEVEAVLQKIQTCDPPGIGARHLQECLSLQLERMSHDNPAVALAKTIVRECYQEFVSKHYAKILKKLRLEDEAPLREAIEIITRLNPKPGGEVVNAKLEYIIPDFILSVVDGHYELSMHERNAPAIRVSPAYANMLQRYDHAENKRDKEALRFIKQKIETAKWFVDAVRQRRHTLLKTMQAIIDLQRDYFLEGDERRLKPMILRDVAEKIGMDISTVSRIVSRKYIDTPFGVFPLHHFFSEGIHTDAGEEVSSHEVKNILRNLIEKEDKSEPLTDDKLVELLRQEGGYTIARRTIAKYRESFNIPIARLRKEI